MRKIRILLIISQLSFILICGCTGERIQKGFEKISADKSGIDFKNNIEFKEDLNIFNYRNFFNGGGVAIGDLDNDGLSDIYFTNNLSENKLYLNKGDFQFEDITRSSGTAGSRAWSTGVVLVDINNDDLLDIYVCNAGYVDGDDRENELFINQGDLTFVESAKRYGLNESGYTTHAAFFDYDMDGDLDAYLLNNSFIPVHTLNNSNRRELYAEDWPVNDFLKGGGDKLLRNENGKFKDVSKAAGIYGSLIGFGLGITLGDVNQDNLLDIYISNDFFERDYLYINQGDGTFTEGIKDWMSHISLSSMGSDMGDIDNDGNPEIFVTEMLPDNDIRIKTISNFEDYSTYLLKLERDFYHQYMHNTLQYNNGDNTFSEISWYSGVSASDWSWGALMFDVDNNGYKDLYVCNGVFQDMTDQDFLDFMVNDLMQEMVRTGKKKPMHEVASFLPSNPQVNKLFYNGGKLKFTDAGEEFGINEPSFSNGAAYGDLDNDGDLDLVVNNLNQEAFVYRNNAASNSDNHYLSLKLRGPAHNRFAIGSKINVFTAGKNINYELIPTRGFQSSVDYKVVLGIGQSHLIDSLVVTWPDTRISRFLNVPLDTLLYLSYAESLENIVSGKTEGPMVNLFERIPSDFDSHKEDPYVDFFKEGLIIKMLSREGPAADKGDLNGDGLEDVIFGGASHQAARLYLQTHSGYRHFRQEIFTNDAYYEDTAIKLFDVDGDSDLDLFAGSGGNSQPVGDRVVQDRIYLNDGQGNFSALVGALPSNGYNTSVALPIDLDGDQDLDLFIGSRSTPLNYGIIPRSYLYENDGIGNFRDVTSRYNAEIGSVGMVTDACISDINNNGDLEILVVGEWMSPKIFELRKGKFIRLETNLDELSGWWYSVNVVDLDQDGLDDLILGNRGENFYFTGSKDSPVKLWVKDFDNNGDVENIITRQENGADRPLPLKREITDQLVSLKKKNLKHSEYASKSMQDLFTAEELDGAKMSESTWFKSIVALNREKEGFEIVELPKEVQFSCVYDIYCADLNQDSHPDVVLGGNDSGFLPQYSRLDASFGHVLLNNGKGKLDLISNGESGLKIRGDLRQLLEVGIKGETHLLAIRNNDKPILYKLKEVNHYKTLKL